MPLSLARKSLMPRTGVDSLVAKSEEPASPNKFETAEGNSWAEPASTNLSMRRRASSLIQKLPPSPRCAGSSFSAETSIDSFASHNAHEDHNSRATSRANQYDRFSCDRNLAEMESYLIITQRKLQEERKRNELLEEKVQALGETCERTKRQNEETFELLNKLTSAVRKYTDEEMPSSLATSETTTNLLRDALACAIGETDTEEHNMEADNVKAQSTEAHSTKAHSTEAHSTEAHNEEEHPLYKTGSKHTESFATLVEPSDQMSIGIYDTTPTNSITDGNSKGSKATMERDSVQEECLVSRRSTHDFGTATSNSILVGLKRKSLDQNRKASKSSRNSMPEGLFAVASSKCKEGPTATAEAAKHPLKSIASDERFSYVDGYDVKCASAPRPTSVAQANRHSAIIGDQLLCLQIFAPPLEDGFKSSCQASLEPLTPESPSTFQIEAGYLPPSALSTNSNFRTSTSAPPSEDNPAISCRVNRSFESPLGGGYVTRRFEKKHLLGRISASAYRSQQVG